MYHLFYYTVLLTLQSDQRLHMTHMSFVGFVVALAHMRRVFQAKLSFGIYLLSLSICASGMVCGIVSGM